MPRCILDLLISSLLPCSGQRQVKHVIPELTVQTGQSRSRPTIPTSCLATSSGSRLHQSMCRELGPSGVELQNFAYSRFFKRVEPSGVLKEGTNPEDGTWCGHDARKSSIVKLPPSGEDARDAEAGPDKIVGGAQRKLSQGRKWFLLLVFSVAQVRRQLRVAPTSSTRCVLLQWHLPLHCPNRRLSAHQVFAVDMGHRDWLSWRSLTRRRPTRSPLPRSCYSGSSFRPVLRQISLCIRLSRSRDLKSHHIVRARAV